MKIRGLCVIKNESDIIEQTLRSATQWCDSIYILDNGSSDGTWEKVQVLAKEMPSVIPYKQDSRPFDDSIRGDILRNYADSANLKDWWCILDADEFYIDNPREFLQSIHKKYKAVWMQLHVYHFTDKDLAAYQHHPNLYDHCTPIEHRLRYYRIGEYSELRFFRHLKNLTHMPGKGLHPIYPRRIRLKHFAYRSPEQIRIRLETRREPMQRGEFLHEKRANWVPGGTIVFGPAQPDELPEEWKERLISSSSCHYDRLDGTYAEARPWIPPQSPSRTNRLHSLIRSIARRARAIYRRFPA
jgi:glycosyltransferase involved in cell wall biosynthesis